MPTGGAVTGSSISKADRAGWLKHVLGLAAERSLPPFKKFFLSGVAKRMRASTEGAATREVLLFVDSFNNYMEPDNRCMVTATKKHSMPSTPYSQSLAGFQGSR